MKLCGAQQMAVRAIRFSLRDAQGCLERSELELWAAKNQLLSVAESLTELMERAERTKK